MERKRQREIAMGAVVAAIIGVAGFQLRSATSRSAAVPASQPVAGARVLNQKGPVTDVDLQALQAERPEPTDSTRDPFRFTPKPAPPPPPEFPTRPTAPVQTGPVEPPPPPRILLKFIGIVESARSGRVAVLSDARGVYQGREGEMIEGRYRILKIGVESTTSP